jgi:DNA-binding MarR family transcriptional regulator
MSNTDIYLKAMMSLIARQTFSPEKLKFLISARGTQKHFDAFNLCDGTNSQSEVVAKTGLDAGNFSRTVKQWIDDGIILRVGDGKDARPVHVYPLPDKFMKSNEKDKKNGDE